MAVIDIHAHIYPDKIAERAVQAVSQFYDQEMKGKGTAGDLIQDSSAAPITHFCVHSVATTADSVESINTFIAKQCAEHPEFVGFMAMHQDYADPESEIERAIELGLRGMKLHPDTQKVNADDPRLMAIYEMIEGRLPLTIHAGDFRYEYSAPERIQHILHTFPDLVIDAAHMGGWSRYDEAVEYLGSEYCFVDASSTLGFIDSDLVRKLIGVYGVDRVMFGSDFPMWNPAEEYAQFRALGYSEDDYEKMLWHNAEQFLGFELEG